MLFGEDFVSDPAKFAVILSGLALVVALVAVLHYTLERKTLLSRIRRLEAAMAPPAEPQTGILKQAGHDIVTPAPAASSADDFSPDMLPPGTRFV